MAFTKQNTRIPEFSIHTDFQGATGTALTVNAVAHLESLLINDADPNDVIYPRQKTIVFDLIDPAIANLPVVVAGVTGLTYQKLAAGLRQACLDRATAQGVS